MTDQHVERKRAVLEALAYDEVGQTYADRLKAVEALNRLDDVAEQTRLHPHREAAIQLLENIEELDGDALNRELAGMFVEGFQRETAAGFATALTGLREQAGLTDALAVYEQEPTEARADAVAYAVLRRIATEESTTRFPVSTGHLAGLLLRMADDPDEMDRRIAEVAEGRARQQLAEATRKHEEVVAKLREEVERQLRALPGAPERKQLPSGPAIWDGYGTDWPEVD